ncbi:hypothetical protein AB6869_15330 [Rahnella rivi]|uniref:hypothetical protein n=1 Tax=Rahnella TaxID=34037 RepID=UPI0010A37CBA|nr:hypothetical protein [Rahnella rivi]THD43080.1 hypothetical protein ERD95_21295 [Enterobacteriaceae bacterium ML5]
MAPFFGCRESLIRIFRVKVTVFNPVFQHFSEKRDCHQTLTKGFILPCVKIKRGAQTPDGNGVSDRLLRGELSGYTA